MTPVAAPLSRVSRSENTLTRYVAELVVGAIGTVCIAIAIGANQRWLDQHFLPSFLLARHVYALIETSVRVGLAALGAWLVSGGRTAAGRFSQRQPAVACSIAFAVILAFGAAEIALTHAKLRPAEWLFPNEEPLRQSDSRLGWTFVPSRSGHRMIGGRDITYAFDSHGYRVRNPGDEVDRGRPTVLFTGESVMVGEGLTWEESIPAHVGAALHLQTANVAVHGYTSDQAYMRLEAELPQFRRPVAVVTLFMPALLGRNIDDDRPHFEPGLVWIPAQPGARLTSLLQLFVPYRSDGAIDGGIRMTREILRATEALAHRHGATSLTVVPQFGNDDDRERVLRQRILDGVSHIVVDVDPHWRIPWDRHPDTRAARKIADTIVAALHNSGGPWP